MDFVDIVGLPSVFDSPQWFELADDFRAGLCLLLEARLQDVPIADAALPMPARMIVRFLQALIASYEPPPQLSPVSFSDVSESHHPLSPPPGNWEPPHDDLPRAPPVLEDPPGLGGCPADMNVLEPPPGNWGHVPLSLERLQELKREFLQMAVDLRALCREAGINVDYYRTNVIFGDEPSDEASFRNTRWATRTTRRGEIRYVPIPKRRHRPPPQPYPLPVSRLNHPPLYSRMPGWL